MGEVDIVNAVSFFNRNWLKSLGNVLNRHYYPDQALVDTKRVKIIQTENGSFYYSRALQQYYNLFEQIEDYKTDDLQSNDVVLDIGANLGAFTVLAAKKVRYVIAVEPLFYEELQANVQLNGLENAVCLPFALDWVGPFTERWKRIHFCGRDELVPCKEFKSILSECPVQPNFLKIDCEGGEWSIDPEDLEGFRAIEAEVHNFNGANPMSFVTWLHGLGFSCNYSKTPEGQLMVSARRG
jgi:hypothetical protein